jgi:hypothetical protein
MIMTNNFQKVYIEKYINIQISILISKKEV